MDREAGGQGASPDMQQEAAAPTIDEGWTGAHVVWISPSPSAWTPPQLESPLQLGVCILWGSKQGFLCDITHASTI
jgi:hypothetical protein